MKARLRTYPHFELDHSLSGFHDLNKFTVEYLSTLFQNLLIMDTPQALDKLNVQIKSIQVKLKKREVRIKNLIRFHLKQSFSDYKSMRYSRMSDERSTIGFLSKGDLSLMAPIVGMIVTKSQQLEASHKAQINRIDERLKALVHRNDSYTSDNPVSPFNLLNIFVLSIDSNSFSIYEIKKFFFLVFHELDNQIEDLYNQIEYGINCRLKDTSAMSVDLLLDSSGNKQIDHVVGINPDQSFREVSVNENRQKILFAIREYKKQTQSDYLNHDKAFTNYCIKIDKLLNPAQREILQRYNEFITSLLSLEEVSVKFKKQIASFSWQLALLALCDHQFLEYEFHPVYLLIDSATDYELAHGHSEADLSYLSSLITQVSRLKKPTLSDYQKIFDSYEKWKVKEINQINISSTTTSLSENESKFKLIQITEEITEELILDDDLMVFFFDDWQKWLRHLASKKGIESNEIKKAIEIMEKVSLILLGSLQLNHDDYSRLINYIESAWLSLGLPQANRENIFTIISGKVRGLCN
jgi:hypothetical protein